MGAGIGSLATAGWPLAADARGSGWAAQAVLAQEWIPGTDPAGWLVSEKFDGVRALWDGQRLYFRSGREIHAPDWFAARLPKVCLDGELWLARGQFEALCGIVRTIRPDDTAWHALTYQVFEMPGAGGTFETRAARLATLAAELGWLQLQAVPQVRISSAEMLQQRLSDVVASGGEGLVLHRAMAPEVSGRTPLLRKFKPLQDAEARVIAHLPGQGKYRGRMGALQVRMADGREFQIGTGFSDAQRENPPGIGERMTFTYRGLTNQGLPRFASYLRAAPAF